MPAPRWRRILIGLLLAAAALAAAPPGPDPAPPPPGAPRFDTILQGYLGAPPQPGVPERYQSLWVAPYFRQLTSGAEWVEGGRDGYRCMWMFLENVKGDKLAARVTFVGGYGDGAVSKIIDRYADDRDTRLYNGSPWTGSGGESNDCPQFDALGDHDGPAERPTLRIYRKSSGNVLEVRDYLTTVFGPNVTVHLHSNDLTDRTVSGAWSADHTVYQTVIVQGLLDGQEIVNVYYEVLDRLFAIDVTYFYVPLANAA
jgi:hypothetical protein